LSGSHFLSNPKSNLKGNFGKIVEKNSKVFVMKISEQIQTNMAPLIYEIHQNPGKILNEDEKQLISKLTPLMDWMFSFIILFFKSTHFLFSTEKENSYLKNFLYVTGILATTIEKSVEILSKSESTLTSCFKVSEMKEIQKMINGSFILIKSSELHQGVSLKKNDLKSLGQFFVNNMLINYPMSMNELVFKLDLLPKYEGILSMDQKFNFPKKEVDIFTQKIVTVDQHRKCMHCGRVTNVKLSQWIQSVRTSCWICGSFWKLEI
jgi:hypothetical protein